jgi:hypothetical protein
VLGDILFVVDQFLVDRLLEVGGIDDNALHGSAGGIALPPRGLAVVVPRNGHTPAVSLHSRG